MEPPSSSSQAGNEPQSIISIVSSIAESYKEQSEKITALVRYLLHYQHYNAEYSILDRERLKYPPAVFEPTQSAVYTRSDDDAFKYMILKVTKIIMPGPLKEFETIPISNIGLSILRANFSSKGYSIFDFPNPDFSPQSLNNKKIIFVTVSLDELHYIAADNKLENQHTSEETFQKKLTLQEIAQVYSEKDQTATVHYVFQLTLKNIDCNFIWVAGLFKKKSKDSSKNIPILKRVPKATRNTQEFNDIKKNQIKLAWEWKDFSQLLGDKKGKFWFKNLCQLGGVVDRLALYDFFVAHIENYLNKETKKKNFEIDFLLFLDKLSLSNPSTKDNTIENKNNWEELIGEITENLKPTSGVSIYQQAILEWDKCFFKNFNISAFAKPLLDSQVANLVNKKSDIVQWSKAYQNLCEIVFLCIDAHPDVFTGFDSLQNIICKRLDTGQEIQASVGLFPYCMTAISFALENAIKINKGNVAYLGQN